MAPKQRLIDAEELAQRIVVEKDEIADMIDFHTIGMHNGLNLAHAMVLNAPTVDAVEVVHGRWEKHLAPYTDNYWSCTCCNGNFMTDAAQYWRYCPNCGAKMDGAKR